MELLDTLIVGAGISGLSLAHALVKEAASASPRAILVAESQGRVGGNITTATGEGFLWEEGSNSFFADAGVDEVGCGCGVEAGVDFGRSQVAALCLLAK
ncbi:NAD(P)-binding protein [Tychonema sp. LEGE 07203]|uniref:NAD(P)-binding protein n=1 Tax=Tychonema sp. LEGE 07203 TaxID=1828671 RepID=UPI0021082E01|nr:NAD(P)-binding protein [Tychonema sp. LEGE 07203]